MRKVSKKLLTWREAGKSQFESLPKKKRKPAKRVSAKETPDTETGFLEVYMYDPLLSLLGPKKSPRGEAQPGGATTFQWKPGEIQHKKFVAKEQAGPQLKEKPLPPTVIVRTIMYSDLQHKIQQVLVNIKKTRLSRYEITPLDAEIIDALTDSLCNDFKYSMPGPSLLKWRDIIHKSMYTVKAGYCLQTQLSDLERCYLLAISKELVGYTKLP